MKNPVRPVAFAALLVAGIAPSHAAVDYVDLRVNGIYINDGRVVVEPVNNRYAKIATPEVSYNVEMKAGCKGVNQSLKDMFVAFGNANMNGSVVEANPGMVTVPVAGRGNKEMGYAPVLLKVPAAQIGGSLDPVQACNAWLDQRLAQGASLMQIWTKDHSMLKPVTLSAVAACGGNSGSNDYRTDTLSHQLTIVCKAGTVGGGIGGIQAQQPKPPQAPGGIAKIMEVTAVELKALTPMVTGNCPAKVRFQGEVTADAPGSVQYQVRFPSNANTPEQSFGGQIIFQGAGKRVTPPIEFNAVSGYPVGVAVIELVSAGGKKAQADFKVQCVQAQGPGSIQVNPKPGDSLNKIQPSPQDPRPGLNIQAVPVQPKPPGSVQAQPQDPKPAPARALQSN